MTERIIIVTGSRAWPMDLQHIIWQALAAHHPTLVVHGGCGSGADEMAECWCERMQVDSRKVRARWTVSTGDGRHLDRGAGHARNSRMLELYPGAPVLAFPHGKASGTRGCILAARQRGHHVTIYQTQ